MASSTSKRTSTTTESDQEEAGIAAAGAAPEIARQQLAAAADAMSTLFRVGEAIQQAQLQMGQRAALLHSQAAENLRRASSPLELASIQSTLVVYQMQEAMRFWQELTMAVGKAASQAGARPAVGAVPGDAAAAAAGGSPAAAMMGAAMSAAAPMADAFQQMFTAPLKAAASQQQAH